MPQPPKIVSNDPSVKAAIQECTLQAAKQYKKVMEEEKRQQCQMIIDRIYQVRSKEYFVGLCVNAYPALQDKQLHVEEWSIINSLSALWLEVAVEIISKNLRENNNSRTHADRHQRISTQVYRQAPYWMCLYSKYILYVAFT